MWIRFILIGKKYIPTCLNAVTVEDLGG